MRETPSCPHCGNSLQGVPIPEKDRHLFGNATHFRREILVEIREIYDGGLFYQCPDCDGRWHRFSSGPLHEEAKRFVEPQRCKAQRSHGPCNTVVPPSEPSCGACGADIRTIFEY